MTKLVAEDKVYFVDGNKQYLFDSYSEAINEVKNLMEKLEPEDILLMEMSISGDEIEATQIPWSQIAQELI